MSFISHKLQTWVAEGLISEDQARGIKTFEQNKKSFFSLFSIILFLGVFSIACGIVAIVSANWNIVPPTVKLTGMFVVLIAAGIYLPEIEKKHPVGFDAGLFFVMLLFFAAIGLIGQIYHLKSDSYKAFLFWSGLAFPLLFLTKRVLFGWIWESIFIGAVFASPLGEKMFHFIGGYFFAVPLFFSFLCVALFFMLLPVRKAELFVVPLRTGLFVGGLCLLFGLRYIPFYGIEVWGRVVLLFFLTAVGFAAFVHRLPEFTVQQKQSLWIITGLYLFLALIPAQRDTAYFSELLIFLAFIFTAYSFKQEKKARLLAVVTAFRMLTAFFSLFGSLLYTGIGMIFSGFIPKSFFAALTEIPELFI